MLSEEEVKHIALLARIGLTDDEALRYRKDLSTVLDWMKELEQFSSSETEVIGNITGRSNVARTDLAEKAPLETVEGIHNNFPDTKDRLLKVRSVF